MIPLDAGQKSALSAGYARKGYAVLPRLVDPAVAAAWELQSRSLPARKVQVGREHQSMWLEQKLSDPARALDGLACADGFIDLAVGIAGLDAIERSRTEIWINRYGP